MSRLVQLVSAQWELQVCLHHFTENNDKTSTLGHAFLLLHDARHTLPMIWVTRKPGTSQSSSRWNHLPSTACPAVLVALHLVAQLPTHATQC